jgi:hypothetical protein
MNAKITGISQVKTDKDGEPYVEFNPRLLAQVGWDDRTLLEWELIGNMAVIRKKEDGGSSSEG